MRLTDMTDIRQILYFDILHVMIWHVIQHTGDHIGKLTGIFRNLILSWISV